MKVEMEVQVLNFLLIQRPLMDAVWGEVVEEAFLQAPDRLLWDSWVLGWVLAFILLRFFVL